MGVPAPRSCPRGRGEHHQNASHGSAPPWPPPSLRSPHPSCRKAAPGTSLCLKLADASQSLLALGTEHRLLTPPKEGSSQSLAYLPAACSAFLEGSSAPTGLEAAWLVLWGLDLSPSLPSRLEGLPVSVCSISLPGLGPG